MEQLKQPMNEHSKRVDQYGKLRGVAHQYFSRCNGGPIGGRPHIRKSARDAVTSRPVERLIVHSLTISLPVLALLVISEKHRRRGAGGLLLQWGIEKSERLNIPCCLQASAQDRRLYKKYSFQAIDIVEFNLNEYGLEGREGIMEMIPQPTGILESAGHKDAVNNRVLGGTKE